MIMDRTSTETGAIDWQPITLEMAGKVGALLRESASPLASGRYLTDPKVAFSLVWEYSRHPDSEVIADRAEDFPNLLRAMCGPRDLLHSSASEPSVPLLGDRGSAFKIYLDTIAELLRVWRTGPPPPGLPGSIAAHWCVRHPDILQQIQTAMRSRSRYFVPEEANWTYDELRPGGPFHHPLQQHKKLALVSSDRFIGQRTWSQAARTAAYALFGDFLTGKPEDIGFCRKCEQPFERGKRTLFCSLKCARCYSATSSHDAAIRLRNRKAFRKSVTSVAKWVGKSHRAGSDWRRQVENAPELVTRDGRHSRTVGFYIRAAESPLGSPDREKLLDSLLDTSVFSAGTIREKEREKLRPEVNAFLENIRRAQAMKKNGKRSI
jgi:hypothetical protein